MPPATQSSDDRYSAFGKLEVLNPDFTAKAANTPLLAYTYTGREWEPEAGLYFNRARFYDPSLGRFLSRDPIGEQGSVNLYGYVDNDPINAIDPTGLIIIFTWPNANTFSLQMYRDAMAIRIQGHQMFPGEANSSARHQWAAQDLAERYDIMNARMYGMLNEIEGFLWQDLRHLPSRLEGNSAWAFQLQDLRDNEIGFDRARPQPMPEHRQPAPTRSPPRPRWRFPILPILS